MDVVEEPPHLTEFLFGLTFARKRNLTFARKLT